MSSCSKSNDRATKYEHPGSGVSKCQGRNAQVCAEGSHGPLSSQVLPSQAQLTGWTALSAGTGARAQPAVPMLSLLFIPSAPLFWAELKLNSLVLFLLKTDHWSPLEDRSLKPVKFRNPFMFVAFSLHFSESLTKSYCKSMLGVCLLKVAVISTPLLTAMSELHVNIFRLYNPKQDKSQGCPLMLQRSSTSTLSRRYSFLWWWKCFAPVLSIMVASSYMWPLSIGNGAAVTEGLNFYLYVTLIKFKEPHVIPST